MNLRRRNSKSNGPILWFIVFRLVVLTSLVVAAVIIQYSTSSFLPLNPYYYIILISYFLSLIYFVLFLWGKNYSLQAYLQIIFDLLLITTLVYISGGLRGSFYFLYIFVIIAASVIISSKAAYLTAGLAAIFFGLLVDGMYFKIIPYFNPDQYMELSLGHVLYNIFIAWSIFFIIAFLTNYLTNSLRGAKEKLRLAQQDLEIKNRLALAGQVSASIAHEVRNPLAAVSGSAQLLKKELELTGEQKELMDIISKESKRASQSVEHFLDLAAPGNRMCSPISLTDTLREILTILQGSNELNGNYRIEGNFNSTKVRYYGNVNQFKQIFWNLLKNALKAMPGGGTLTINFVQDRKDKLQIKIADTGKGMTREEKERVFEPFYSGFDNGRGLGMSIVYRIVDDYEGKIHISSEINKGTEVTITLPMRNINNH